MCELVWSFVHQHVCLLWWGAPHHQWAGCGVNLGVCIVDGGSHVWVVVAFIVVGSGVMGT